MRDFIIIFVGCLCTYWVGFYMGILYEQGKTPAFLERKINTYTIVGENMRERVQCEFDEPLKYVNLIMHAYDSNEEMYADYILLAEPVEHEEIWGWSNCVWQPEDSWAACDVYYVKPEFVHADMNIDTIGHEVLHGMCGDFHG